MESERVAQVILYDGVCGLCDRFVQFVLRRDSRERFHFAPIQSDYAAAILARHGWSEAPLSTVFLVVEPGGPNERVLTKGRAAIEVVRQLGKLWPAVALLKLLPRAVLDWGYDLVARNRYRLFGKFDACKLPTPQQRTRFLGP